MKTTRKATTLSEQQDAWVKARIGSETPALKKAIQEGLGGGISKCSVKEIWQKAERRYKA